MRTLNVVGFTLTFAALALLAGCSGSQMATTPLGQGPGATNPSTVTTQSYFSPDAKKKPLIFVSDYTASVVDIYLQAGGSQVGQITGVTQPSDVAADKAKNVYIASSRGVGASQHVAVYAPPYTGAPKLTIANPSLNPQALAVSKTGVVAVVDSCNGGGCFYVVNFYAKNATTSCAMVGLPSNVIGSGAAFDAAGNLFVVGQNGANGFIGEITGGCSAKSLTVLSVSNTLGLLAAVQIDKAHRIAILGLNDHTVYTYNPPAGSSLGSPTSTTTLTTTSTFHFAFPPNGRSLYTGGYINGSAMIAQYNYPAGGSPESAYAFGGLPYGVAVTPALIP